MSSAHFIIIAEEPLWKIGRGTLRVETTPSSQWKFTGGFDINFGCTHHSSWCFSFGYPPSPGLPQADIFYKRHLGFKNEYHFWLCWNAQMMVCLIRLRSIQGTHRETRRKPTTSVSQLAASTSQRHPHVMTSQPLADGTLLDQTSIRERCTVEYEGSHKTEQFRNELCKMRNKLNKY